MRYRSSRGWRRLRFQCSAGETSPARLRRRQRHRRRQIAATRRGRLQSVSSQGARSPADTRIRHIAIKRSRARWNHWPAMLQASELIETFCESSDKLTFANVAKPMLQESDGPPPSALLQHRTLQSELRAQDRAQNCARRRSCAMKNSRCPLGKFESLCPPREIEIRALRFDLRSRPTARSILNGNP